MAPEFTRQKVYSDLGGSLNRPPIVDLEKEKTKPFN